MIRQAFQQFVQHFFVDPILVDLKIRLPQMISVAEKIAPQKAVPIQCQAPDKETLLVDWLSAIIYQMDTRKMLFADFEVEITGLSLKGIARGEKLDYEKHLPNVEPKAVTYHQLAVKQNTDGTWIAQCVVDV